MSGLPARPSLLALLLCAALATGCTAGADPTSSRTEEPTRTGNSSASAAPTNEESESPAPTSTATPSEEPASAPTASAGRFGRLLTAEEVPGFSADYAWTEVRSGPAETAPFGACQQAGLIDLGAMRVVQRDFDPTVTGADGDSAAQQVATFPDGKTASRALAVVRAWHRDCEGEGVTVGPIADLDVDRGTAFWYAVDITSETAPDDRRTERLAVARQGRRVALVRLLRIGRPLRYGAGEDPAEVAASRAWSKLA